MLSARPPPVRSSVPTERRNTRHSREGGGMRLYLYHSVQAVVSLGTFGNNYTAQLLESELENVELDSE